MRWAILISLLLTTGCVSSSKSSAMKPASTSTPISQPDTPSEVVLEIRKFYQWLSATGQLVRPCPWNPMTKPKGRGLDPKTLKPLPPKPEKLVPTQELIRRIGDKLKGVKGDPC